MRSAVSLRTSEINSVARDKVDAWLGFTAMTLFIFATSEVAPIFSRFLWQRTLFTPTLGWFFAVVAFFFGHYILSVVGLRSFMRIAVLLGLMALYGRLLIQTGRIERFHMLEYGVLTFLGLKALASSLRGLVLYPAGFVMVFLVSLAEEGFQEILPSRYFAWEDVEVNAQSVALATLILACIHWRDTRGLLLSFFGEDRRSMEG